MYKPEWYHICNFCKTRKEATMCCVRCVEESSFYPDCERIIEVSKEKHISIADMVALVEMQRRKR